MALTYAGHYSDGRSAARREVQVHFATQALVVSGDDGTPVSNWDFAELRLAGELYRGQPVVLTTTTDPRARLTVADRGFLTPLLACAPQLRARGALDARSWLRVAVWGLGAVAFLGLLIFTLPRLAEPMAALLPVAWEETLGEQFVSGFLDGKRTCTASAGTEALRRLTERLAATVDTPYSFTVRVVDIGEANAFAGPGGQIVIFRGLLAFAETPDEVAGVLAHEMAHVVERHPTEAVVRALGLAFVIQLLAGDASGIAGLGAEVGEALLGLAYSRRDEAEADAVAVAMLNAADIRADGLATFLGRLDAEGLSMSEGLAFLSSHPPNRARSEAVAAAAGSGRRALSATDWGALESICE